MFHLTRTSVETGKTEIVTSSEDWDECFDKQFEFDDCGDEENVLYVVDTDESLKELDMV